MVESQEAHFEKRITDALVGVGILGAEQLERSRQVSQSEGSGLLETLVSSGMVARGQFFASTHPVLVPWP